MDLRKRVHKTEAAMNVKVKTDDLERAAVRRMAMESARITEATVPSEIMIAPWGEVETSAGSFLVDEASISATVAAFAAHGTDLPIDYEHQTLGGAYSSPTGQAPAAGWIKGLRAVTPAEAERDGTSAGLWALVEWTREAARKLSSREYRYLSPVALVRKSDRRLVGLHSAALTNKPAITGMRPLVTSDARPGASGLPADFSRGAEATTRLCGALHLSDGTPEEVLLIAAAERIALLEARERERAAEDRVAAATSAGKLTAAQRAWAYSLALRDPAEFDRWEASAPQAVPLGVMIAGRGSTGARENGALMETAARAEWRAHRSFLSKLCSEEAYAACARRDREAEESTESA